VLIIANDPGGRLAQLFECTRILTCAAKIDIHVFHLRLLAFPPRKVRRLRLSRGIAGTTIPYPARLAAICDVYDAPTTLRPYKRAWSQGEAVNLMLSSPGHFDTDLLSAFVSKMIIHGTLH
jgi:hypothetical protein